jgi:hypothetical protein
MKKGCQLNLELNRREESFSVWWKLKRYGNFGYNHYMGRLDNPHFVEGYLEPLLSRLSIDLQGLDMSQIPVHFDLTGLSGEDQEIVRRSIQSSYRDDPGVTYTQ